MTAAISRNRPFVDGRGALTQYGWAVMQSIWGATGGAVTIDADDVTLIGIGLAAVGPTARPLKDLAAHVEPVGLGKAERAVAGDVGPVRASAGVVNRSQAFGCITVSNGSSAEATTDATPRKIAAWAANGLSKNMINDHTSDDVEVLYQGTHLIIFMGSFDGTNTKHYHVEIYVDSSGSGSVTEDTIGASDVGAFGATAILKLAPGEKVSVYHWSTDGGTTFTLTQGTLAVIRLGD